MHVKSDSNSITAKDLIAQFASHGRYSFSSEEARLALNVTAQASKLALHRLSQQGLVASPARGFYVIVPPEYRSLGCLPAEQFIPALMNRKGLNYYAGLLSAAQYYGAAHQRPQQFQAFLAKNRRPIKCGKVRIKFIARKNIENVPTQEFNTPRGVLRVSSPEATAIDLVGYERHAGGLDQVATIVSELSESMDPESLAKVAVTAPIPWAQRLGYILDLVGQEGVAMQLREFVSLHAHEYTKLSPTGTESDTTRLKDWKLIVNTVLDPDT